MPWFAHLRNGDHKGVHRLGSLQRVNEIIGVKENSAPGLSYSKCAMNGNFYSGRQASSGIPAERVSSAVEKTNTAFLVLHFHLNG